MKLPSCVAVVVVVVFAALPALALESPEARFARASKELAQSDYDAAIVDLEALADRGFVHPDVSFDRGVAYAMRARTKDEHVGDLGRAAAGFEEALLLRPHDHDTEVALDAVRAEVKHRRSRRNKDDLIVRPSLDRLVIGLLGEDAWAALALGASVLLAIGLLLRRRRAGPIHVAGSVLAPAAALALLVCTPLAVASRWLGAHRRPGVVVASEVSLSVGNGKSLGRDPIPEAATVEVGETKGDDVFVRWGSNEGYVSSTAVRVLQR